MDSIKILSFEQIRAILLGDELFQVALMVDHLKMYSTFCILLQILFLRKLVYGTLG
jgi:hypothetical protein